MQGENILLEEIAKLKTELDRVKFELFQMTRRNTVADANGNVHPSWETAPHKELLDSFKFQGAMTKVLLDETNQQQERITLLKDAIRGMMSHSADTPAWEIGGMALNEDERKDVW